MGKGLIVTLLILLSVIPAWTAEYDFFINFGDCRVVVGYLVLSNESLRVFKGDPTVLACKRLSRKVQCDLFFEDPNTGMAPRGSERYTVILDSPPLLYMEARFGAESIAIDTARHAATVSSRIVDHRLLGAKVCAGIYATDFEMEVLRK